MLGKRLVKLTREMFIWTLRPCFTASPALLSVCMCELAKIFFTSKFLVIYFSPTPPIKLKLGHQTK
jgi:hypothetical protein